MHPRRLLPLAVIAAVLPAGAAAQDLAAGKALYAPCVACHGEFGEGKVELNAPAIGGQEPWYLERQLLNFRAGLRGSDPSDVYGMQMKPMASVLVDDAAVRNAVAYVASLKPPSRPKPTIDGDADAGKMVYLTCSACHGAEAAGSEPMNAPSLRNQHDWYLVRQLQSFKSGLRGVHPKDTFGMQMKPMADTLGDEAAIHNVVAYIVSL